MWRLRKSATPRVSLRRIYLFLATSLLVASFATIFSFSTPVSAAPAVWDGDQLTYEGNDYDQTNLNLPNTAAEGDNRYMWIDSSEDPQKAHVIYFDTDRPQRAEEAQLVIFDYSPPDNFANPSSVQSIEVSINLAGEPIEDDGDIPLTTCDGNITKGIGWILCPVSNWIADGVDWMYTIVKDFLEVPIVTTDTETGIYALWQVILGVANICFALVFLAIIYSHLTSAGFSTYNIKAILPRLLLAAVLVNVSFWLCALAIDISNVLGYSINNIFVNIRENMNTGAEVDWSALNVFIMSGGTVAAGLGFAAAAGGSWAGLGFLLLAALAGVAFAIFVAFVVLAARQAIITVLLILSPLAFVAFVLPSTRDMFNRWRKSFTTLLMFFPVFAVLFGGSGVAGAAIMNAADGRLHIILIGMATQVVPLVLTPLLIQFSSGLLGRIAGLADNSKRGVTDRAKNWAHDNADYHASKKRAKWAKHAEEGNKRRFLNPAAVTGLGLDQNKRRRERAKSASESYLDKRADEDWKRRLNSPGQRRFRDSADRRYQQMYMDTHDLSEKAKIHEEALDSRASEHWQRSLANNPAYSGLRQQRSQTHLTKGRAEALDQQMTAADQRNLDTLIAAGGAGYSDIRQAKLDTVSDNKHAQFQASQIDAEGERQFQGDFVDGTQQARDLRKQRVSIDQTKKETATIDNTLQKQADAHWEYVSKNDDAVKSLRINEAAATDSHRRASAEWNKVIEDIRLKGSDSAYASVAVGDMAGVQRAAGTIKTQTALAMVAEKAAGDIKTTYESKAQASYIESAEGQILSRTSQAAQDTLAGIQAEETAIVQEWRTEKGAENLTGQEAAIAEELRTADITKRVYTRRSDQAGDITAQEYAGLVKSDATIPGSTKHVVETSAGIAGRSGETQAKAQAHQTIVSAAEKAIAAETTLFSQIKEDHLLSDTIEETGEIGLGSDQILNEPTERIAAMGSSIAKRYHMKSHLLLWHRMGQLQDTAMAELESAKASGDADAIKAAEGKVDKVKDLQQQVMGDKTKKPFGIGDEAQGDASVGVYRQNPFEAARDRIMTHLSVESMANMDPDDLKALTEMAREGKLNDQQLEKISKIYDEWKVDDNFKSRLAEKHRRWLDPIQRDYQGQAPDYPPNDIYGDIIRRMTNA